MKTLFVTLTMLALAVTAFAYPGPDSMGIYFDADASSPHSLTYQTAVGFEQVSLYLVISNPTQGGVSGWEGTVEVVGTATAPTWVLSRGLNVDPLPHTANYAQFQVGIGVTGTHPGPILPNGSGNCLLATWTGFLMTTDTTLEFYIKGIPDSATFPDGPGYASADDPGLVQAVFDNTGLANANFCINTDCGVIGNEDLTFSNVKALYR